MVVLLVIVTVLIFSYTCTCSSRYLPVLGGLMWFDMLFFVWCSSGSAECLLDRPGRRRERAEKDDPGEIYKIDKQCELMFGRGFKICPYMVNQIIDNNINTILLENMYKKYKKIYSLTYFADTVWIDQISLKDEKFKIAVFFILQPDDCKRLWCTDSTSKSNACKTLHMPWADGTKCAEGMVRLTLSHCLIKVSVSISLSPSLSRSLSLPKKRNPSNPTLFLSVSTTTPNSYPQPLDPFVHVDRLSKNGETLHRYMNNISSHQVWFLILKSFYCSYFFPIYGIYYL